MSYGQPNKAPRPAISGRMLFFLIAIGLFFFLNRKGQQQPPVEQQPPIQQEQPAGGGFAFPENSGPENSAPLDPATAPGRRQPMPRKQSTADAGDWSLEEVEVENRKNNNQKKRLPPTESKNKVTEKGDWKIEEVE